MIFLQIANVFVNLEDVTTVAVNKKQKCVTVCRKYPTGTMEEIYDLSGDDRWEDMINYVCDQLLELQVKKGK